MRDVIVEDHGSIIILRLVARIAREWADQWIPDAPALGPHSACVERNYADAILEGMRDDGLTLGGEYNA